jgi:hypothetical protein
MTAEQAQSGKITQHKQRKSKEQDYEVESREKLCEEREEIEAREGEE